MILFTGLILIGFLLLRFFGSNQAEETGQDAPEDYSQSKQMRIFDPYYLSVIVGILLIIASLLLLVSAGQLTVTSSAGIVIFIFSLACGFGYFIKKSPGRFRRPSPDRRHNDNHGDNI